MKIIISPAKSLNYKDKCPINTSTQPLFLEQSKNINQVLKKLNPQELSKLMNLSDKLANLNWQRNQTWQLPFNETNAKQALYAFDGEVYTGINAYRLSNKAADFLQQHLWILSGLYGILKPFDLMQAYRLEMGTNLMVKKHKNLYDFWKSSLTKHVTKNLGKNEPLINLASQEYASVLDFKQIKNPVITPLFKDYKNGSLKTISFFAKKARGLMVKYIAEHQITQAEDLKMFNTEGYQFDANISTKTQWIFTR